MCALRILHNFCLYIRRISRTKKVYEKKTEEGRLQIEEER